MATQNQPKDVEIKGEHFVVYSASQVEEAKLAEKRGYDVLIEHTSPESGNLLLDSIPGFERRQKQSGK